MHNKMNFFGEVPTFLEKTIVITGLCAAFIIPAWIFHVGKKNTHPQASIPTSESNLDSPV
jgi:hypothetical protein